MVDMAELKAKGKMKRADMRAGAYKRGGAVEEEGLDFGGKKPKKPKKEHKIEGTKAMFRADRRARGGSVGKKGATVNIMIAPSKATPTPVPVPVPHPPMLAPAPAAPMGPPPASIGAAPMGAAPMGAAPMGAMPPKPGMKRGGRMKNPGYTDRAADKFMDAGAGGALGGREKAKAYGAKPR